MKKKFIDPLIKRKANLTKNVQFYKKNIPLPSVVEISESGTCNRKCSFCPRSAPDFKDIKEFISDKSLHWELAKVIDVNQLSLKIEIENKEVGFIDFKNIKWTRKKSFEDLLKLNDIIYVSKIKKDIWPYLYLF